MSIADSIILVSCLSGFMFASLALLLLLNLLFPHTTYNVALRLHRNLLLPFIIGIVVIAVVGIPAAALFNLGSVFQLAGLILFLLLFLIGFTGMAGLARLLGMRVAQYNNREVSPFTEAATGTMVLVFALAFPLVGWFFMLPIFLVLGVGIATLAYLRDRKNVVDVDETFAVSS